MDISEATLVLEYAANHIDGDNRRGVFIKALVEGEEWAETDFKNWCEQTTQGEWYEKCVSNSEIYRRIRAVGCRNAHLGRMGRR